jgi:hypothetical protein
MDQTHRRTSVKIRQKAERRRPTCRWLGCIEADDVKNWRQKACNIQKWTFLLKEAKVIRVLYNHGVIRKIPY